MIDPTAVAKLERTIGGTEGVRKRLAAFRTTALETAGRLRHLAVRGDLAAVLEDAASLRTEAEIFGLRRLANRLIEMERVAVLEELGQAHLQSQALARLIDDEIDDDLAALEAHLKTAAGA